jgi:hypothetical protein
MVPRGGGSMNGPAPSASERIEKFCDEWPRMRGHDADFIYGIHLGDDSEAAITLTDLRSLLADLRSARGEVESLTRERDKFHEAWWAAESLATTRSVDLDALSARVEVLTSALSECRRLLFLNPRNEDVYEQRAILDAALAASSLPEPSEDE